MIKAKNPVLVDQFFSDGERLVEITGVGKDYIRSVDVVSELEVVIAVREIGHDWFKVTPARS